MDLKTPALTLYVVSMLLWCAPPAEAQSGPTILGLSYSAIDANSYAPGTTVDVTVDSAIPASAPVCRWTPPTQAHIFGTSNVLSSTLMTCELIGTIAPFAAEAGAYTLEVSLNGGAIWSSPVPFFYDCAVDRWGPTCASCSTGAMCLFSGFCDDGMSGTGYCLSCPAGSGRCGADCLSFCSAGCGGSNDCEQATCGCFSCNVGLTGSQCQTPCDTNCSDTGGCDQSTAVCNGCDPGWHGSTCQSLCGANCAGAGTCAQANGTCDFGCVEGFGGPNCETPATAVPAGGAVFLTLAALLLAGSGAMAIATRLR